jgi:tRNA dimethylallyltransferase
MKSIPKLIVIVGPTASGKSDMGVVLAKKYDGEVISADSRQVYKGLNIGSGKVSRDRSTSQFSLLNSHFFHKGVRHHLLDVASPRSVFSVARYQKLARTALHNILRRGKIPIIVGGTGLYVDSILYETTIPEVKPNLKLRKKLEKKPPAELFAMLARRDPRRAGTIDRHNKRRLVRALEIIEASGEPVPERTERRHSPILQSMGILENDVVKIGLNPPAERLKRRIHARLLKRMRQGMIAEVKHLRKNGLSWKRLDDLGLEYRYVSRYLHGFITKDSMVHELEKEIWRYSRRQMTWFKREKDIRWIKSSKDLPGL